MAGRRINIFYLISLICTLVLIAYICFIFIPQFNAYTDMMGIKTVLIMVIVLLSTAAAIQFFLLIRPPQSEE
ncbi:hypothetical protein KEJ34_01530 [Candidatus Bathyarchaeota archaeon]|nr:hypothetical protein [Candidatus Bathyarchaeota archaeon]